MKKAGNRPLRVAELVKRELAVLIPRVLDDSRTHQATVTFVDVSPDLRSARVYFTLLGGAAAAEPVVAAFNRAAGHLRRELAGRVALRVIPELRFYFDASIERGDRLSQLIDRAVKEDQSGKDK
ncbi:MAG: 30S ribosome-binding factor RbfA [Sulfurifustis sp.]|jgi:ribosome-binding factor A